VAFQEELSSMSECVGTRKDNKKIT
jgi:hypothetical protein